jgi:hypothetical protein
MVCWELIRDDFTVAFYSATSSFQCIRTQPELIISLVLIPYNSIHYNNGDDTTSSSIFHLFMCFLFYNFIGSKCSNSNYILRKVRGNNLDGGLTAPFSSQKI